MAKNLRPCNFIVKKGGEALSSVEATAKALEGMNEKVRDIYNSNNNIDLKKGVLYHGTTADRAKKIKANGFYKQHDVNITEDKSEAEEYAQQISDDEGGQPTIIGVRLKKGAKARAEEGLDAMAYDAKDVVLDFSEVIGNSISEAYHAAKKDGSNPELVKAVEDLLGTGKEKSMSFDEMREYLLANPDVWMPSSTRKIGAGKMQPSLGGRGDAEMQKIAEDAKANGTYLKAPNGKPTNLNERQWAQVRTEAFKNWFGDWENDPENASKIVDENGEPQVMYTGTSKDKDFDKFNVPQNGVWFTADPEVASRYAIQNDSRDYKFNHFTGIYEEKNTASRVVAAFLNIRRPEFFNKSITDEQKEKYRYASDYKKLQKQYFQDIYFRKPIGERTDGLYYSDDKKVVVVLEEPTQIKSAIGNMGTFSPVNPKLQFSEGGRGEEPKATDPNVRKAIIKAGQMFRESGNDKRAAISAGVDELVKAGYSKKDATDIITPVIERIMQPTAAGSSTSPAGWIAMKYIPQEVRNKIDVSTTTVENMKALGEMAVKNGEVNPENLAQEFANGFSRPLSPVEVSALVYYKAQLHNKITEAYKALEDAKRRNNASQIETEEANVAKLEQQLQNYYIASRKSAYEMGLAFRLRQMLLDQDYELIEVETKYRAKYGPIPAETKATFEELEKQRKELLEKEKQLELDREAFEREKTMAGLVQQVEQKKKGNDTGAKSDQSFIVRNILNNIAKIPSMFSRKIKGQASAGLRAGEQTDGEYIWEQAVTMAANELQKMDKPDKAAKDDAIKKGLEYIKSTKWYKSFDADEKKQIDSEYMTFMRANTKDPSVKVTDDERIVISHKTLRDYTERVLADNPLDKDDPDRYKKLMELVSKEILKDMASELPLGTSWQDIRDAITKYGQQTQGSKEDLEVEIRKMKQLGLKMAQLEAVLSGNKPLKTGYQRDPQSPEARFLVEQINEGLKKLAISEMESEAFLRSSLDRIKTSLKNQIEDLEQQIKEGKRKVREKSKVVYDEEATTLKELRDLLKDQLDKIDPKGREISAEKQLNNLIANLERSIQEYERRIKEKDFSAFKQVKAAFENLPRTDEYKKLKDERDKLKKQFEDLKKGPQKSPLDKRLEDLQDEYDSLLDGTYQPKQPPVQYNDPRLTDLRDKIKALKLQLGFKKSAEEVKIERLRKELNDLMTGKVKNKPAPSPDSPQATALRDQIKNLKDQMGITAAAELSRAIKAKEAQLRKVDERIAKLQATGQDVVGKAKIQSAIIDDLNDQIKDRRKIVQDLLDQHGITVKKLLETEKKRIRNLIAEKEERIRTKNFGPKVSTARKLTEDEYDQELRDLQIQKQLLYEKYEEEFYKAELDNRPKWQKVLDSVLALWDVSKSAVSGLDMSAPLRQGLFLVLSESPATTLSAFKFMFEATFANITDEAAVGRKYDEWLAGVKASPEYQAMKASGLYLAEQTTKGKAAEDAFANNLIYNIPFIEKPIFESIKAITGKDLRPFGKDYSLHLYKRSEVAYNAFLNYMRVAAFSDAVQSLGALDEPITYKTHPEEFKAIAEVINISSGRATLGRAESAANYINKILFSVRLVWSRFLYLFLPFKAPFMPPAARKREMIKYGRAMGSLAAIMTMLILWLDNDDDEDTYVEIDPRGKFMNININENTSINLTAGMSQWVSFLSKLMTQQYKKTTTGEVRRLGETMYDPNFLDVIAQFIAGKAAPTPRLVLEYAMAQPNPEEEGQMITAFGERYSVLSSLGNLAVPLILGDVEKAAEKNSMLTAMGLSAVAFFGGSINVKSDKYKLPSEIMSEALNPTGKEYKLEAEKARIAIKQKDASALKKSIEKQAPVYANYKMISKPDEELAKSMYAQSLLKSYQDDKLLEKTGLKSDEMRQMFFLIMSGSELPEVKESNPAKKEAIYKMREDLINKFKSIPEPTRQNILGQYKKQAQEVEDVISLFNKLNLEYKDPKTDEYKKIDWRMFLPAVQWYQEYEYFYKTYPNFRKQVNSK